MGPILTIISFQLRHLPTARVSRSSRLSNSFLASRSTPFMTLPWQRLLGEFSRVLASVPASIGFMWCIWHMYAYVPCSMPCTARSVPDRIDYFVASLWVSITITKLIAFADFSQGTPHCASMSFFDDRFIDALETLLPALIHFSPLTCTTRHLLASNSTYRQHFRSV